MRSACTDGQGVPLIIKCTVKCLLKSVGSAPLWIQETDGAYKVNGI